MKWKHVKDIVEPNSDLFRNFRYWCDNIGITEETMLRIIYWFYFNSLGINAPGNWEGYNDFSSQFSKLIGCDVVDLGRLLSVNFETRATEDDLGFSLYLFYNYTSNSRLGHYIIRLYRKR